MLPLYAAVMPAEGQGGALGCNHHFCLTPWVKVLTLKWTGLPHRGKGFVISKMGCLWHVTGSKRACLQFMIVDHSSNTCL